MAKQCDYFVLKQITKDTCNFQHHELGTHEHPHPHVTIIRKLQLKEFPYEHWGIWESETHQMEPAGSSKFPFNYADNYQERVVVIEGESILTPSDGADPFTLRAGDFVCFHQGFACEWEILKPMRKHYCYFDEGGNEVQPNNVSCDRCGVDCYSESYFCNDELDLCPTCFTKKEFTNYEYQKEGKAFVDDGEGSRKKAKVHHHDENDDNDDDGGKKKEQQEEEFAC